MFCYNTIYTEKLMQLENPLVKSIYCFLPFVSKYGVPSRLFSDLAGYFNQGGP